MTDPKAALVEAVCAELAGYDELELLSADRERLELRVREVHTDIEHTSYLGNLFEELRDLSPEQRAARIARFVRSMRDAHHDNSDWEEVRARIYPVVRGVTVFLGAGPDLNVVSRPFLPFVVECLVIDAPGSLSYVTRSKLEAWGVDEGEAFATAHQNFSAGEHSVEPYDGGHPPLWHVSSADDYESARILLPALWEHFESVVQGRPVIIIPHRSALLVGGTDEPGHLERLLEIAEKEAAASPRFISTVLYSRDDAGRVLPLDLGPDHPLADRLRHAQTLLAGTEYGQQKQALERRFEEQGIDVFVASLGELTLGGERHSYAVWTEGVDTLLPEADILVLLVGDPEGAHETLFLRWADVLDVASHHLETESGLVPIRYRTIGWPNADELFALRARVVPR